MGKKKNFNSNPEKKKLIEKDDQQSYARIIQPLGNSRMLIRLANGMETQAIIRGSHRGRGRGKPRYCKGDVIIVSPRDFDNVYDIIHKYTHDEVRKLANAYEIPMEFTQDLDFGGCDQDLGIDFTEEIIPTSDEDPFSETKINFDEI